MRHRKRRHGSSTDKGNQSIKVRKSLGALFKHKKTQPRSPDLTGQIGLQPDLIEAINDDRRNGDGDEVVCNIAGWLKVDKRGSRYITVELSPTFWARRHDGDEDIDDFLSADDQD